jgi:hypothetical protein
MYLETPPLLIETRMFSSVPQKFSKKGVATLWADANRLDTATVSTLRNRRAASCWSRISAFSSRHCEERKRRSNPVCGAMDCFARARNDREISLAFEEPVVRQP